MGVKEVIATLVGDIKHGQQPELDPKIGRDWFKITRPILLYYVPEQAWRQIHKGVDQAQRILGTFQKELPTGQQFDPDPGTLVIMQLASSITRQHIEAESGNKAGPLENNDRRLACFQIAAENLARTVFSRDQTQALELAREAALEVTRWHIAKQNSFEEEAAKAQVTRLASRLNGLQSHHPYAA